MSILHDKELLNYALQQIPLYVEKWDDKYKIYQLTTADIPDVWNVLLLKTTKKYMVTDSQDSVALEKHIRVSRELLIKELQDFTDINYKVYYKQLDQKLVGYLLDFFLYYVEMPDKIITEQEDNIELYKEIRNQKLKP